MFLLQKLLHKITTKLKQSNFNYYATKEELYNKLH